jgi:hypothetical protein
VSELSATVREAPGEPGASAPGTRYGRFVVQRLLGYGGMGAVFAAKDPELDREVAIKVLHTELGVGGAGGAALRSEAQAMARLTHPNTVSVYEVGEAHGQTFIVMELIAGTTLRAWLDERSRPWTDVVAMFVRAGRGLEAAHKAGLVHRDFKPENVLVDGDGWPRVCDFGLASVSFAKSGGTPAYMAPEQWLEGEVDARADQFSYAVALWRALAGAPPFPGDSRSEVCNAVLAGAIAAPPEGSAMPRAIEDALRRAMSRSPEARWSSLTDLLDQLARSIERRARRPRWVVPVAGVAVAATAGFAVAFAVRPEREGLRGAAVAPPPPPPVVVTTPDAPERPLIPTRTMGRAPYKLTASLDELDVLANQYARNGNLDNLEQTLERMRMLTNDVRERANFLLRLGNVQASLGECEGAKKSLARHLLEDPQSELAGFLRNAIASCEKANPPPAGRVPSLPGTGVGFGPITLTSGNTDTAALAQVLERLASSFRGCVETARHGGLRLDHVGIDTDVLDTGLLAVNGYEDVDDAGFVKCMRRTLERIKLPNAKSGRVRFTLWFDD